MYSGSEFNNPGSNEHLTSECLEPVGSDTNNILTDSQSVLIANNQQALQRENKPVACIDCFNEGHNL